jgi:Na+/glutamate symporter
MSDAKTIAVPIVIVCFIVAIIVYVICRCLKKDENATPGTIIEHKNINYSGAIML